VGVTGINPGIIALGLAVAIGIILISKLWVKLFAIRAPPTDEVSTSYRGRFSLRDREEKHRLICEALKAGTGRILRGNIQPWQEAEADVKDRIERLIGHVPSDRVTLEVGLGQIDNFYRAASSVNIVWIPVDEVSGSILDGHAGVTRNTVYIFAYNLDEYTDTEILKLIGHETIEREAKVSARRLEIEWTQDVAEANHDRARLEEARLRAPEMPSVNRLGTLAKDEVGDERILRRVLRASEHALAVEMSKDVAPSADVIIITAGTKNHCKTIQKYFLFLYFSGRGGNNCKA